MAKRFGSSYQKIGEEYVHTDQHIYVIVDRVVFNNKRYYIIGNEALDSLITVEAN